MKNDSHNDTHQESRKGDERYRRVELITGTLAAAGNVGDLGMTGSSGLRYAGIAGRTARAAFLAAPQDSASRQAPYRTWRRVQRFDCPCRLLTEPLARRIP